MKKIFGIASIFIGVGLIVCLILGFALPLNVEIPSNSVAGYKILRGIEFFILYLPAVVITGFTISCSVYFGKNPEGSADRFSAAMFKRLKSVMISAIVVCAVLTLCTEIFGLLIRQNKEKIVNKPKLINEYIRVGNELFDEGFYNRATRYAEAALKINPESKAAISLKDRSGVEINRQENANYRFRLYESANETVETVNRTTVDGEKLRTVYDYFLKAVEYFDNQEWFNAHYYAELGLKLADNTDPNYKELRYISTKAWNKISMEHVLKKNQDQLNFDKKYEGYRALVQKDNLKAYYIFKELFETSPDLQRDPDVKFYLNVAENNVRERYFFIDETMELSSFEDSNDVYFSYPYKDGSVDIIYFKGVTNVRDTGKSIQYLRQLTIVSIDASGNQIRKMTVPYAKILPVDVKTLNSTIKMEMGIDNSVSSVPYVMLNSVARDAPGTESHPVFTYAEGQPEMNNDFLILPISYDDFILLEDSGQNFETMPLISLFKMVRKSEQYGFSPQIYGSTLLNRILYPLLIIIIMVFIGAFGWNTRTGMDQYFKLSWMLAFPLLFIISLIFYELAMFVFKLINFAILGSVGGIIPSLFVCLGIYLALLLFMIIYFCSRSTKR